MKKIRHRGKVKANLDINRERVRIELMGHNWGDTKTISYWGKSRSKKNVRRIFRELSSLRRERAKPKITEENIVEFKSLVIACVESLVSCEFSVSHGISYEFICVRIGSISNNIPYRSKTITRVIGVNEIKYNVRVLTRGTGHQLNQSLFKERLGLNLLAPKGEIWNPNIEVKIIRGSVMFQDGWFIW